MIEKEIKFSLSIRDCSNHLGVDQMTNETLSPRGKKGQHLRRSFSIWRSVIRTSLYRTNERQGEWLRFWFASVCSNLRRVGDASLRCRHVRFSLILTTSMDAPLSQTCLSHLNRRRRRQMMKLPFEHWKRRIPSAADRNPFVSLWLIQIELSTWNVAQRGGGRKSLLHHYLSINGASISFWSRELPWCLQMVNPRPRRTSRSMFTRREWFLIDSCLTALYICRCIEILALLHFLQMYGQCWRCGDVVLLIIVIIWWETRRISVRKISRRRSSLVECNSASTSSSFYKARVGENKRIRLFDSICFIRFFHRIRLVDR